jgi:hypothetical protein
MRTRTPFLFAALVLIATLARGQMLTPVWIELGENGQALARVVVNAPGDCPAVEIGGLTHRMELRAPVPSGFKPACELAIQATATAASVTAASATASGSGQALALPRPNPRRVVVFGDTGCRIKPPRVQACNDPAEWPFARVASGIADARVDLAIHVGDYNYREEDCPPDRAALCGGTPSGDNWDTWNAEFFAPAAKLLAAVPLALSRGNHEDCNSSWRGWFYYLDPRPWKKSCVKFSPPYVIRMGQFELAMLDSAEVSETDLVPKQVKLFGRQLQSLRVTDAWLVDHHPFWAIRLEADNPQVVLNTPSLKAAWEKVSPKGINLLVSGHTHLFEMLSLSEDRPPQLVAGDGGTALAIPLPMTLDGIQVAGAAIASGESVREFGYTILTKASEGWDVALKNTAGRTLAACTVRGFRSACAPQK